MTDYEIRKKVTDILYSNMISGYSKAAKTHFHYTRPSRKAYPHQYFWDTCFHVFTLTALGDHDMAKKHIISLFAQQDEDGFVGHILFWNIKLPVRFIDIIQSKPGLKGKLFRAHMSALIQPPLAAQAVLRIHEKSGDHGFLNTMLPKLKKYYDWIARNRDFDGDGLITMISPFESGMDWKPTYDPMVGFPKKKADWRLLTKFRRVAFRNFLHNYNLREIHKKGYFLVKDVGFNTIYAQNLQALAMLCEEMKDDDAGRFRSMATRTIQSIIKVMYDDDSAAFFDVKGKTNAKIKILTPTIFYPVVLEEVPEEIKKKVIKVHFLNKEQFDVPFPIPSVAKNHPSFDPGSSKYIWRGPTWIVHNWFMHQFLMENGYRRESKMLITSIEKLIEKSGFREYYNPFTGEGYGAHEFTWAGLVIDMVHMEKDLNLKDYSQGLSKGNR